MRTGVQVCAVCLQESDDPYLKRQWRFAWHTTCERHSTQLIERCPTCSSTISPIQLTAQDRTIEICHVCKSSLSNAENLQNLSNSSTLQNLLDNSLLHDTALKQLSNSPLDTQQCFGIVEFYISLIRRAIQAPTSRLAKSVEHHDVDIADIDVTRACLQFELLPVDLRDVLLKKASRLMTVPLVSLIESFNRFGVTQNTIRGVQKEPPNNLLVSLNSLPNHRFRRNRNPSDSKTPKSKAAVLKKWNRLKRKAGVKF